LTPNEKGLAQAPPSAAPTAAEEQAPAWGTASVDFNIGRQRVRADIQMPAGPIRARQMLPLLQALTDLVVAQGVQEAEARGEKVTCQKGCGACCRQLVPITPLEARHLRDLIETFPEPRRSQVRARFAQARQRLQEAGLLERLQHLDQDDAAEREALALTYFRLQIACPFLEDESCSIHADRPLICREYLVTSPARHCAELREDNIRGVPLAGKVSEAVGRLEEAGNRQPRILLVLAPEWAETHPAEPPPRPGPDLLREVFDHLAARGEGAYKGPLFIDNECSQATGSEPPGLPRRCGPRRA
jgi:Fe-S-cluster containining protein